MLEFFVFHVHNLLMTIAHKIIPDIILTHVIKLVNIGWDINQWASWLWPIQREGIFRVKLLPEIENGVIEKLCGILWPKLENWSMKVFSLEAKSIYRLFKLITLLVKVLLFQGVLFLISSCKFFSHLTKVLNDINAMLLLLLPLFPFFAALGFHLFKTFIYLLESHLSDIVQNNLVLDIFLCCITDFIFGLYI